MVWFNHYILHYVWNTVPEMCVGLQRQCRKNCETVALCPRMTLLWQGKQFWAAYHKYFIDMWFICFKEHTVSLFLTCMLERLIWEHTSNMFYQTCIQNSSFNTKYTVKDKYKCVKHRDLFLKVTDNRSNLPS